MYEELKKVYEYFDDEESRMIFRQRLLYALTGDCKYIKEMLLYYRKENKGYYDILDVLAEPEVFMGKKNHSFWYRCMGKTCNVLVELLSAGMFFFL